MRTFVREPGLGAFVNQTLLLEVLDGPVPFLF